MADWFGQNSEALEPLPVAAEEVEVIQELLRRFNEYGYSWLSCAC